MTRRRCCPLHYRGGFVETSERGVKRRRFLVSAAAFGGSMALRAFPVAAQATPLTYADMHSHIGILGGAANVRDAMVGNRVLVIARKIVADGPVIRRVPGKGVQQAREPAPGEL